MLDSQNFLSGKRKYLFGLILLSFVSVVCLAFNMGRSNDFDFAKKEILLRQLGHEILLQSGDSTSRVLPIKKLAENEYQISFEHELTFQPGSLVTTTQRLLAKDPQINDYIVNVLNCGNTSVTYGFAISKNKKDDIVACIGRKQPRACYTISIKFKPKGIATAKNGFILGSLPFLAFIGFIVFKSAKPGKTLAKAGHTGLVTLGAVLFDAENRKLIINENTIDLTATETRVLRIFALLPNEIIERSRLQKEIWEDEGVVVGRSLDMFISKLRKKLEVDPDINIVVVRGKGYRLEINV